MQQPSETKNDIPAYNPNPSDSQNQTNSNGQPLNETEQDQNGHLVRSAKEQPIQVEEYNSNTLGTLLNHHIHKSQKITRTDLADLAFSAAIAASSCILYIEPTKKFAGDDITKLVWFMFCVLAANFNVGAYAAHESFDSFRAKLPRHLANEINDHVRCGRVQNAVAVLVKFALSLVSAVPNAVATDEAFGWQLTVGITTAVINYLAVQNFFGDIKSVYQLLTQSQQEKDAARLKQIFEKAIQKTSDAIVKDVITRRKQGENVTLPPELSRGSTLTGTELLKFFAKKAQAYDVEPVRPPSTAQVIFEEVIPGTAGALLVLAGLFGFMSKTHELVMQWTTGWESYPEAAGISFLFNYLGAKFGAKTLITIAKALDQLARTGTFEKSVAMQIYPGATGVAMSVAGLVSLFSFATSVELIDTSVHFSEGGALAPAKPVFEVLAAIAAVIFNNYANQQLSNKIIEIMARHWGSAEKKDLAIFASEIEKFLANVKNMPPQKFAQSLQALDYTDCVKLLPMYNVDDEVDALLASAAGDVIEDNKNSTFMSTYGSKEKKWGKDNYGTLGNRDQANFQVMGAKERKQYVQNQQAQEAFAEVRKENSGYGITDFFRRCFGMDEKKQQGARYQQIFEEDPNASNRSQLQ